MRQRRDRIFPRAEFGFEEQWELLRWGRKMRLLCGSVGRVLGQTASREIGISEEVQNREVNSPEQDVSGFLVEPAGAFEEIVNLRLRDAAEFCESTLGELTIIEPELEGLEQAALQIAESELF